MNYNNLKNKTILIVEDDPFSFELIHEYFSNTGVKIIHAKTGNDAIYCFKHSKRKIDLILMDIKIPEKSGIKATKEIRESDKKIPIIAQTANVIISEPNPYISSGMDDYILKPYKQKDLIEIVLKHLPKVKSTY